MRLSGRVALIAGAGGGMGTATPMLFAQEGARVVVAARRRDPLEALVSRIAANGGEATHFQGDFMQEADVERAVAFCESTYGRLDVVMNNLGESLARGRTVEQTSSKDWSYVTDFNLRPAYLLTRFAVPALRRAGGGVILHQSASRDIAMDGHAGYAAAKAALLAFTEKTALEYRRDNIRVVCLQPNMMGLGFEEARVGLPEPVLERYGGAADLAWAALFLASPEAAWITGVCLPVDGGASLETRPVVIPPHLAAAAAAKTAMTEG